MIALYPGSFDPVTNGHMDIIKRVAKIAQKLIIAVLINSSKQPFFSIEKRLEHLKILTKDFKNVEVNSFNGLTAEFAKEKGVNVIVKGLRNVSDFELEAVTASVNRHLSSNKLETFFIPASSENMFLSSSVVKEIVRYGNSVKGLVPDIIEAELSAAKWR